MRKLIATTAVIVVIALLAYSYTNRSGFLSLAFAGEDAAITTTPAAVYSDTTSIDFTFNLTGLAATFYSLYFIPSNQSVYTFPAIPFGSGGVCIYSSTLHGAYCCKNNNNTTESQVITLTQAVSGTLRTDNWSVYADQNASCDQTLPPDVLPSTLTPLPAGYFTKTIPLTTLSATPSVSNIVTIDTNGSPLGTIWKTKAFGIQATVNAEPDPALDCNVSVDGNLAATKSINIQNNQDNNQGMLSTYGPLQVGSHSASVSCTNNQSGTAFTGSNSLSFSVVDLPPSKSGTGKPNITPSANAYNNIAYTCNLGSFAVTDPDDTAASLTTTYSWTSGSQTVGSGQTFTCTPALCKVGNTLSCSVTVADPGGGSVSESSSGVPLVSRLSASISNDKNISTSEGATVTFSPTVTGGTNLTYSWDFGDGNVKTTAESTVSHVFFKKGSGTTVYHVTLTASDNSGNTATDAVDVTVRDAQLSITVEEPAEGDRFERMKASSPLQLKVKLRDSSGNLVSGGKVNASIASSRVELKETSSGNYEASYLPKWNDPYSNNVVFDANATINGIPRGAGDSSRTVYFTKAQFDVNVLEPGLAVFGGSRIPRLKFVFLYPDKSQVQDINSSDVKAVWGPTGKELALSRDGNAFVADLNYEPSEADIARGKIVLSFSETFDKARNFLGSDGSKQVEIEIRAYDANFSVSVVPSNALESTFAYGQNARFEASLKKPAEAQGAQVYLDSIALSWHKQFSQDANSGKWVLEAKIPSESEFSGSEFDLAVGASATLKEQRILAAPVKGRARASNELVVSLVNPNPDTGTAVSLSEIRARIEYPNGAQYDANSITMQVNGKELEFVKRGEVFVASYALKEGKQDLAIKPAEGTRYETKEVALKGLDVKSVSGLDLTQMAMIGAAVLLLLGGVVMLVLRKTGKVEKKIAEVKGTRTLEELEQQRDVVKASIKKLEYDFYKRHIQEEDYKKRLNEYNAQIETIEAKIKVQRAGGEGQAQAKAQEEKPKEGKVEKGFREAPPWIARMQPKPEQEGEKPGESKDLSVIEVGEVKREVPQREEEPKSDLEVEFRQGEGRRGLIEVVERPRPKAESSDERDKIASIASKIGMISSQPPAEQPKRKEGEEPRAPRKKLSEGSKTQVEELVEQYKGLVHKYNAEDLFNELTEELGYPTEVAEEVIARLKPKK